MDPKVVLHPKESFFNIPRIASKRDSNCVPTSHFLYAQQICHIAICIVEYYISKTRLQNPNHTMGNDTVYSEFEPWGELSGQFCIDLAKAGCRIIAAARRVDRLKSLCDEINRLQRTSSSSNGEVTDDVRAVAVELDVSAKGPTIEASVKRAWDAFGRIDVLINNAGMRGYILLFLD
ncbi:putative short-chain dehydrogenase/reductase SDR, NAD(P)-binding domain superfamily [Helianthus debilis subsp. tardiflorus]